MISSTTVNFNAEIFNVVIFFRWIISESSDFCRKACGQWRIQGGQFGETASRTVARKSSI